MCAKSELTNFRHGLLLFLRNEALLERQVPASPQPQPGWSGHTQPWQHGGKQSLDLKQDKVSLGKPLDEQLLKSPRSLKNDMTELFNTTSFESKRMKF